MKRFFILFTALSLLMPLSQNGSVQQKSETIHQHDIQFIPLKEADFQLVYSWLHSSFVKPWFVPEPLSWNDFIEIYQEKLISDIEWNFIVCTDDYPFGYIRYYDAHKEPDGAGALEPEGSYGIELFIGEPDYLGKGYGTALLSQFMNKLIQEHERSDKPIKRFIIDPNINNIPAYKTYVKVGFTPVREVQDPYYGRLLIMELDVH